MKIIAQYNNFYESNAFCIEHNPCIYNGFIVLQFLVSISHAKKIKSMKLSENECKKKQQKNKTNQKNNHFLLE